MAETHDRSPMTDRVVGAFLGAAIGDALGWPQEQNSRRIRGGEPASVSPRFQTWCRRSGGRFYAYEEVVEAGEYSDDTQLLLATARSLLYGSKWSAVFTTVELPLWLLYERGGGGATKRSADSWLNGHPPWRSPERAERYFEAGGKGVAMRIAPHVFLPGQTLERLLEQVVLNGVATHGHPLALVGARVFAHALWIASRTEGALGYGSLIAQLLESVPSWGEFPVWTSDTEWKGRADDAYRGQFRRVWDTAVQEVVEGLKLAHSAMNIGALAVTQEVLNRLGAFDESVNGAGTNSAVIAIYLASRFAADPVTGLLEAAFTDKTDSDTYACMVGALLGAIHGTEWIVPEWQGVQDASRISSLAVNLTNGSLTEAAVQPWDKKAAAKVLRQLEAQNQSTVHLPALGLAQSGPPIHHQPIAKSAQATS